MDNKPYTVLFTPLAASDAEEIDTYITQTLAQPLAAVDFLDAVHNAVSKLALHPYLGSRVAEDNLAAQGYRRLIVKNYIVFYLVKEEKSQVIIMRILFGARQYRDLF